MGSCACAHTFSMSYSYIWASKNVKLASHVTDWCIENIGRDINQQSTHNESEKKKKEKHKRNGKHNNKQVTYQQGNNNPSSKLIMINFILDILEILVQAAVFENDQDGDDDKITSA